MREAIETIEYKGCKIEIFPDEMAESPREWDNLTEIHYHSRSYVLGDTNYTDIDKFNEMLRKAYKNKDMVIPLFAYIHSGVSLSLASFQGRLPQGHAEFDSGQAGVVIIRRKAILENWSKKKLTKDLKEKAYKVAEGEIKTLNQYFMGDIYGFNVSENEEHVDSCWGFYGQEDCEAEARGAVDYHVSCKCSGVPR